MGRRAKSPKGKAETKRSRPGKSLKNAGSSVHDLKTRLADALKREAEARSKLAGLFKDAPAKPPDAREKLGKLFKDTPAAAKKPLWKQWGGRQEVDLLWIVTRQAPALMAAEAADMCRRHGLRTLKLKGGQGVDTDLTRAKV